MESLYHPHEEQGIEGYRADGKNLTYDKLPRMTALVTLAIVLGGIILFLILR